MKITILYQFFQGDLEPGHTLIQAFAKYLRTCGDEVSVVSGEFGYMDPKPVNVPFWRRLIHAKLLITSPSYVPFPQLTDTAD